MFNRLIVLSLAVLGAVAPVHAQTWPDRPIRLIVPNPPAGPIDIVARVVTTKLGALLGQPVIVDNRPGAGQIIGTETVSRAAPDGYTLGLIGPAHVTNPALREKLPYDSVKGFTPIARLVTFPLVLVISAKSPANSVADVIALARRKGADFKFASSGVGTSPHLSGELLKSSANLQMIHIPFKGTPDAVLSLMRDEIDMYFDSPAVLGAQDARLKPLAMTSASRSSLAPHLQTVADAVPGFEVESFIGLVGPAGLPPEVQRTLAGHLATVMAMPDVRERFAQLRYEIAFKGPDDFGAYLERESSKWTKLIKDNGIRVQ